MSLAPTESALRECCSCRSFAEAVAGQGPYGSVDELIAAARTTPVAGWLEAFAAHPKIGDMEGLRKKYGAFGDMSKGEQAAAAGASDAALQALAEWNGRYEAKFGHIFIICATGKSAEEMLAAIQQRGGG
ncbi:hypothetical protein CHLNCDRAFT_138808 [Chlorella variabilis]|uniref:2-oxo-4-hydroxy-4-carboxy-5-ureidoimidazoline decarboxylase n=1 Tax=Chlorella variabilis TaxID=554065 RepID=E1ZNT1_CHLVA|nr:hypothetical protein CHLNCDRAFT_138808 [Chlorella variabilis]EFN52467.1 hypothetical protein CHLNCDRAFT_138808 [Chlorella variabilis]|eukprot:XP_005844569.1 hypothetical protein CHLNCDRAFT_138808 [Chlorella variabilis]